MPKQALTGALALSVQYYNRLIKFNCFGFSNDYEFYMYQLYLVRDSKAIVLNAFHALNNPQTENNNCLQHVDCRM